MPISYDDFRFVSRVWESFGTAPCHERVAEPKPVPAEIQRLQELLFEHGRALPEGVYVEAMDCLMAIAGRPPAIRIHCAAAYAAGTSLPVQPYMYR